MTTSNVPGAGTDANVYIGFFGTMGSTKMFAWDNPHRDDYEMGQTDIYTQQTPDLGTLTSIKLQRDNAGDYAEWIVEKVCFHVSSFSTRKMLLYMQSIIQCMSSSCFKLLFWDV